MSLLKKVIIVGGTHGNEWTGIIAVQKYAERFQKQFPDLDIHFIFANPEAYKLNKRFKDEDLNRAFEYLHEERPHSFEHQRALEIKNLIDEEPCFVVDLHTTTSNMGNTVILSHNRPINFEVARDLYKNLPDTRLILSPDPHQKYLVSQSEFGLMIEVGPVANSVIDAKVLEGTLNLIEQTLISISGMDKFSGGEVEFFEEIEDIYYPQNDKGELTAYIHPSLQGRDFQEINGKYHAFKSYDGESISMQTKEILYPIFINEAAYYPTKLAFTLCRKKLMSF